MSCSYLIYKDFEIEQSVFQYVKTTIINTVMNNKLFDIACLIIILLLVEVAFINIKLHYLKKELKINEDNLVVVMKRFKSDESLIKKIYEIAYKENNEKVLKLIDESE